MTSQQLPERRPKLIDLNLLPLEYQPRKVSKLSIALVTVTIVLACLVVPFIFLKTNVDADCAPLEKELSQLDIQYRALLPLATEAHALQDQIDAVKSKLETMKADYETLKESTPWSTIIEEIDDAIPGKKVTLGSITEKTSVITLKGTATKDDYVSDYAAALEELEYFSGVHPTSIVPTGAGVSFIMIVPLSEAGE